MYNVVASAGMLTVLLITSGMTVATCTAEPLLTLFEVTMAVRLPADDGSVVNVTVSEVDVAAVTTPTAPLLNVTELLATIGSKPVPAMTISVSEADNAAVDGVTLTVRSVRTSSDSKRSMPDVGDPLQRLCDLRRRVRFFDRNLKVIKFRNEIRRFRGICNLSSIRAIRGSRCDLTPTIGEGW